MRPITVGLMAAGFAIGCGSAPSEQAMAPSDGDFEARKEAPMGGASPAAPAVTRGAKMSNNQFGDEVYAAMEEGRSDGLVADAKGKPATDDAEAPDEAPLRRWFPEAFLWEPLVETDASGHATVAVRVPDTRDERHMVNPMVPVTTAMRSRRPLFMCPDHCSCTQST